MTSEAVYYCSIAALLWSATFLRCAASSSYGMTNGYSNTQQYGHGQHGGQQRQYYAQRNRPQNFSPFGFGGSGFGAGGGGFPGFLGGGPPTGLDPPQIPRELQVGMGFGGGGFGGAGFGGGGFGLNSIGGGVGAGQRYSRRQQNYRRNYYQRPQQNAYGGQQQSNGHRSYQTVQQQPPIATNFDRNHEAGWTLGAAQLPKIYPQTSLPQPQQQVLPNQRQLSQTTSISTSPAVSQFASNNVAASHASFSQPSVAVASATQQQQALPSQFAIQSTSVSTSNQSPMSANIIAGSAPASFLQPFTAEALAAARQQQISCKPDAISSATGQCISSQNMPTMCADKMLSASRDCPSGEFCCFAVLVIKAPPAYASSLQTQSTTARPWWADAAMSKYDQQFSNSGGAGASFDRSPQTIPYPSATSSSSSTSLPVGTDIPTASNIINNAEIAHVQRHFEQQVAAVATQPTRRQQNNLLHNFGAAESSATANSFPVTKFDHSASTQWPHTSSLTPQTVRKVFTNSWNDNQRTAFMSGDSGRTAASHGLRTKWQRSLPAVTPLPHSAGIANEDDDVLNTQLLASLSPSVMNKILRVLLLEAKQSLAKQNRTSLHSTGLKAQTTTSTSTTEPPSTTTKTRTPLNTVRFASTDKIDSVDQRLLLNGLAIVEGDDDFKSLATFTFNPPLLPTEKPQTTTTQTTARSPTFSSRTTTSSSAQKLNRKYGKKFTSDQRTHAQATLPPLPFPLRLLPSDFFPTASGASDGKKPLEKYERLYKTKLARKLAQTVPLSRRVDKMTPNPQLLSTSPKLIRKTTTTTTITTNFTSRSHQDRASKDSSVVMPLTFVTVEQLRNAVPVNFTTTHTPLLTTARPRRHLLTTTTVLQPTSTSSPVTVGSRAPDIPTARTAAAPAEVLTKHKTQRAILLSNVTYEDLINAIPVNFTLRPPIGPNSRRHLYAAPAVILQNHTTKPPQTSARTTVTTSSSTKTPITTQTGTTPLAVPSRNLTAAVQIQKSTSAPTLDTTVLTAAAATTANPSSNLNVTANDNKPIVAARKFRVHAPDEKDLLADLVTSLQRQVNQIIRQRPAALIASVNLPPGTTPSTTTPKSATTQSTQISTSSPPTTKEPEAPSNGGVSQTIVRNAFVPQRLQDFIKEAGAVFLNQQQIKV